MKAATDSKYMMVVTTRFIEPGYDVLIAASVATVNLEICIYDSADMNRILCKVIMQNIKSGKGQSNTGGRVAEAYAKAGKEFGMLVDKKKR